MEGLPQAEAWYRILKSRPEAVPGPEAIAGFLQAMAIRYQERIAQQAYALFQQGKHGDTLRVWYEAKREILKEALSEMID